MPTKESSSTNVANTTRNKPLLIFTVGLILILLTATGVLLWMLLQARAEAKTLEKDKGAAKAQLTKCENDLKVCEMQLDEDEDNTDDDDGSSDDETPGTSKKITQEFQIGGRKFTLTYPDELYYRTESGQLGSSVDLYRDLSDNNEELPAVILSVSDYPIKVTYAQDGEPGETPDENDPKSVTINNKKYSFEKYFLGEGFGGSYSTAGNLLAKVDDDFYVSIRFSSQGTQTFCLEDCSQLGSPNCVEKNDCSSFEPETIEDFSTTEKDIQLALEILEGLKFVE